MATRTYLESFEENNGGWWGWISNAAGPKPLERIDSNVTTRSPWWIDYNHAPPGAGYIHMLMCLNTRGAQGEVFREVGGPNRFISGGFPTDFRDALFSLRLRGELLDRGAKMVVLIQGNVGGIVSGWMLTSQPFEITEGWSEQTVKLDARESSWTALGSRHDRTDMYGIKPLELVLAEVNVNIMLVMFPLKIIPMGAIAADPHILRPEKDYPVWRHKLPEGYITIDEIRIAFPQE